MKYNTTIENQSIEFNFNSMLNKFFMVNKNNLEFDCIRLSQNSYSLIINGQSHHMTINPYIQGYEVTIDHYTHIVQIQDELDILLNKLGLQYDEIEHEGEIHAQIPGLISQIFVKEGDRVEINQKLFILEAMKMENEIDSPLNGIIHKIYYQVDDNIEKGNVIMEIIT